MKGLGCFWGYIAIILASGASMRFVITRFYNLFIRGLSNRRHRSLIKETINIANILEEDHGIFAFGATISVMFHAIIMNSYGKITFLGIICGSSFALIILTGIFYKFIYRDRDGKLKKYHIIFTGIYIVSLILHLKFN